jgi:predicted phosphoribosyltransferase
MLFRDRTDAGRILASQLEHYKGRSDALILALPRGGVPVAYEVGRALGIPVDVFIVRKLGVPGHEELAMGAIASGGGFFVNRDVVDQLGIPDETIRMAAERERKELVRRERLYRGDRSLPELAGRVVILVDDGLATGSSMRAAIRAVKLSNPARTVVAVPTAAPETRNLIAKEVDEMICVSTPEPFYSVGQWYSRFEQISDDEVRDLLRAA